MHFLKRSILDVNVADLPDGVKSELKALAHDLAGALVFDYGMDTCIFVFICTIFKFVHVGLPLYPTNNWLISKFTIYIVPPLYQIWILARRYLPWARHPLSSATIFW